MIDNNDYAELAVRIVEELVIRQKVPLSEVYKLLLLAGGISAEMLAAKESRDIEFELAEMMNIVIEQYRQQRNQLELPTKVQYPEAKGRH